MSMELSYMSRGNIINIGLLRDWHWDNIIAFYWCSEWGNIVSDFYD